MYAKGPWIYGGQYLVSTVTMTARHIGAKGIIL